MNKRFISLSLVAVIAILLGYYAFSFLRALDEKHQKERKLKAYVLTPIELFLGMYAERNEWEFPDADTFYDFVRTNTTNTNVNYIPNQKQISLGKATQIIAWVQNGDDIFYCTSIPAFFRKFNYARGELPYMDSDCAELWRSANFLTKKFSGQSELLLLLLGGENAKAMEYIQRTTEIPDCDVNGVTPLMWAVSIQNVPLVRALLPKTSDIKKRNIFGDDALSIAQKTKNKEIIDLLEKNW